MNRSILNRLLLGASLATTAALAACEEPQPRPQPAEPPMVEEAAPVAEESAPPVTDEAPEAVEPATPVEALPTDQRTSEQTVQPESDTLFY
ncbi:hypothetical protein D8I30_11585 [Brevundimonas naejangsanensis]|uniref:Uncharacterized protein n=1 Tax=Brevundimonas naejangsanensis TaxID=588932 RepID=A0A494RGX9_9CAUL|nr:hypothetical protein [Brevundimonas naejangsanensis]AYG95747.1 hypothetical protein D8I30_11585 [Brevundimonas naejangsanensis]